jgi:hypothetical protein
MDSSSLLPQPAGGVDASVEAWAGSSAAVAAAPTGAAPDEAAAPRPSLAESDDGLDIPGPALPDDSTGLRDVNMSEPWLTRHRRPLIGAAALCPLALLAIGISWAGMVSLSVPVTPDSPAPPPGPPPAPPAPEPEPEPEPGSGAGGVMMGAGDSSALWPVLQNLVMHYVYQGDA